MTARQRIAVAAAPLVALTMMPVFSATGHWLGPKGGWYAGFPVYWVLWCLVFPLCMIGGSGLRSSFGRCRLSVWDWLLVGVPPIVALSGRLAGWTGAHPAGPWLAMSLVNGTLEETLWRATYVKLFPGSVRWAVVWPTLWFAAWHFAPGRLSMGDRVFTLVGGAAVFGLCMAVVAYRTRSIRWTVVSHVMAGLVQL
jgi:hypothetical protein